MGQTSNRIDILYVGHDPAVVKMVTGSLDGTFDQISVETAASAGSGFDRLAKRDTDCLLLETTLPDRDKREFLDPVQAEYPDLPVLLLTEGADDRLESDALANGTDSNDYIHKEVATTDPELLANRIQTLVERVREQRRARALTRIWGLVSDVNQALRRASSRTAAEQRICDLLSQSDPYQFAWIGDVDPDTDRIVPRAAAGMDETYLDEVTVTVDESPTGQGPGGTAIRESAIAVSQDVRNDPAFDPWREAAMEHGYRSVAAIPLEYDDTLYGLLAVYADRTHAFDDDEQAVLADLGDDIAHAFHSFAIETQHHQERIQRETLFENAPVPVAQGSISPDGAHYRISAINSTFESIFGYDAAAVIGQDVADVIVPSDRRDKHNGLRERVASGEPIIAEVQRSTVDDQREFLLHVVPYGTAETPADGWFAWYPTLRIKRNASGTSKRQPSECDWPFRGRTPGCGNSTSKPI